MTRELLESSREVRNAAGGLRAKLNPAGGIGAALRAVYADKIEDSMLPCFERLLNQLGGTRDS